ncbi:MAG: hypothetical protein A2Z88_10480 [Omnitrophica WOR_2 bacterium GWA2_47_8]|nr:MAG: hypothetical protein A2Z88_10480 [Omnitrophica WOR_2 bacterium GWA2_47_8]
MLDKDFFEDEDVLGEETFGKKHHPKQENEEEDEDDDTVGLDVGAEDEEEDWEKEIEKEMEKIDLLEKKFKLTPKKPKNN